MLNGMRVKAGFRHSICSVLAKSSGCYPTSFFVLVSVQCEFNTNNTVTLEEANVTRLILGFCKRKHHSQPLLREDATLTESQDMSPALFNDLSDRAALSINIPFAPDGRYIRNVSTTCGRVVINARHYHCVLQGSCTVFTLQMMYVKGGA